MFTKILRFLLLVLMTVLALTTLAGLAAVLLYAVVTAVVAVITAYLIVPDEMRGFWRMLFGKIDGWFDRAEGLWHEMREALDGWGRNMEAAAASAETMMKSARPAPDEPVEETVVQTTVQLEEAVADSPREASADVPKSDQK